jgi:four helix bundle protein
MAAITRFEDIEAWQKARGLTREIYNISAPGEFARDYGLRDQMRRSSVSTMSNIAEGFERDGTKEFIQFLSIAKGSSGELKSQLYVALDVGYITEEQFKTLYATAEETSWKIGGFLRYLKSTEMRGGKFKSA